MSENRIDDLYRLIDGIEVAMLTTRRPDGLLVSRAMSTQQRAGGADLWFVADISSASIDEILHDPHVNLSYYKDRTREWVSVAGRAVVSQDRDLIRGLWKPDWAAWFADKGGKDAGTPNDPRIALILVEALHVSYLKQDRPMPMVLFAVARAIITRTAPKVGDERELGEQELRVAVQRDQDKRIKENEEARTR